MYNFQRSDSVFINSQKTYQLFHSIFLRGFKDANDEGKAIDFAANNAKAYSFFAERIAQARGFQPRATLAGEAGSAASVSTQRALDRSKRERETDSYGNALDSACLQNPSKLLDHTEQINALMICIKPKVIQTCTKKYDRDMIKRYIRSIRDEELEVKYLEKMREMPEQEAELGSFAAGGAPA